MSVDEAVRSNERIVEVKARIDALKDECLKVQASLPLARGAAQQLHADGWSSRRAFVAAKDRLRKLQLDLRAAKLELTKLSGTTGTDPRWALLAKAYHVLQRLEEGGVDLGDDGRALCDDIEFHVPAHRLLAAVGGGEDG